MRAFLPPPRALVALLLLALALRLALGYCGGQLFIPDERFRFVRAYEFLQHPQASTLLKPDHPLFAVWALPIAAVHTGFSRASGIAVDSCLWVASGLLSLCSVANLYLVWLLARRHGASEREALLAASLMCLSSSMFYYSRHLLPYDLSMCLSLLVLVFPADGWRASVLRGGLAGVAVLTWLGNWYLSLTVLALHWLERPSRVRFLAVAAGFAASLVATVVLLQTVHQGNVLAEVRAFSDAVVYGDFREGWSHPWVSLWVVERFLLPVWLVGFLAAAILEGPRVRRWLIAVALLYGLLAFTSTVLHRYVCYARTDREMVPFLCLVAAAALHRLPRPALLTLMACLMLQSSLLFSRAFAVVFPRDVRLRAVARYGALELAWTVQGVPPRGQVGARYALYNAANMWPMMPTVARGPGRLLERVPHPFVAFPAYQYEQFSPKEREYIRQGDISIMLVDRGVTPGSDGD